jgi:hypothetical protein
MPEWISVKDRLPEANSHVLVYPARGKEYQVWFFAANGAWYDECGWCARGITHWMPLPEPPKEG